MAKSQTGKINLSTVIQEVIVQSNSIAKTKNISLKQNISEEIHFFSDEKIIKTVLRNLISKQLNLRNQKELYVFTSFYSVIKLKLLFLIMKLG